MTFDLAKNKTLIYSSSVIGALIVAIAIFLIYAVIAKNNKEKRIEGEKKELREAFTIKEFLVDPKLITAQDIENLDLTNLHISIMSGANFDWQYKNYLVIEGVYKDYGCEEHNHVNKFLWFIFKEVCYFNDTNKTIEIKGYDINQFNADLGLDLKFEKNKNNGGMQGTEEDDQKLTQYVKNCQAKVVQDMKNLDLNEKQGLFDFVKVDMLGFSKSK